MTQEFYQKLEHLFDVNNLKAYLTPEVAEKLLAMLLRLQEVNAHTNLTAIRDEDGILCKHIADSLKIAPFIPKNVKLLDVGCGGGFPSLPLAIARPDITVTAMDSTEKKVNYVRESAQILELSGFSAVCGRAEAFGHDPAWRESFDVVTARAVAALPMLTELCVPFLKVGGLFIAMKSGNVTDELENATPVIKKLGGSPFEVHTFSLVSHENGVPHEERTIIVAKKLAPTPAVYPRAYAKIKKTPLK